MRVTKLSALLATLALVLPCLGAAPALAAGLDLKAEPTALTIGTFYAGQDVNLRGQLESGQEVVLEVKGPMEDTTFDVKGRVGPFWLNRGQVKVEKAPYLYIMLTSDSAPKPEQLAALDLGLDHLRSEAEVIAPQRDPQDIFSKFLDFKTKSGLYQQKPGAVAYNQGSQGAREFLATLAMPSSLSAGDYQITATVIKDGAVQGRASMNYAVRDGAMLKWVKDMAFNSSLMFGVLCVVIALATGGIMGVVFKGGKGGH